MNISDDTKSMFASWAKVFAAALITAVLSYLQSGQAVNWVAALIAGVTALLVVILNWLNPSDTRYGRKETITDGTDEP